MDEASRQAENAQQRKAALADKRKKLDKLRLEKESRAAALQNKRKEVEEQAVQSPSGKPKGQNLDEVVKSLLGDSAKQQSQQSKQLSEQEIQERENRQRAAKLAALSSQHNVVNINIPSKEVPMYDRGTQTAKSGQSSSPRKAASRTPRDDVPKLEVQADEEEKKKDDKPAEEEKFVIPNMTPQEKDTVLGSREFTDFFSRASRVMERALVISRYDFTKQFDANESKEVGGNKMVTPLCSFFDDALCKGRAVTDISWSAKHPELVIVAYSDRLEGAVEEGQQGMVIVWNLMIPESPEMVLYCQSSVLRAFIYQFNPNYIVGSTYSGQIVLWDKSKMGSERVMAMPTVRTPLSPHGHTLPVFSMDVVGTDNANSLVTVSTDGKMRSWNMEELEEPQESRLDLYQPRDEKDKAPPEPLAVSCTSFVDGDANMCVMGAEDAVVYSVARHSANAPVDQQHRGHDGPITGVSCHPAAGAVDFSGLFLSCSMDWTIRLWDRRSEKPLHTIEDAGDYVYDVKWSPTHPGVFASVDGTGKLSIWNLNVNTDLPGDRIAVVESHALNRVQWSKDGKRLGVGSSTGHCFIYEAKKEIISPSPDDFRQLNKIISELKLKSGASERHQE